MFKKACKPKTLHCYNNQKINDKTNLTTNNKLLKAETVNCRVSQQYAFEKNVVLVFLSTSSAAYRKACYWSLFVMLFKL